MGDKSTRSPACHLRYHDKLPGDILLQDVYVPKSGDQPMTYYSCLGWNMGWDGQGYLGIQDHGHDNRSYIYALWDPRDDTLPPMQAVHTGPGAKVSTFGSEGHGIHMGDHATGWDPDCWYTMVNRCWNHEGHTYFGFWTHNQCSKKWSHHVTFDFPRPNINFHTSTDSFMENFAGSGRPVRSVRYGHGYKRGLDKTWHPFTTAHLHVNRGEIVKDWENNYNGGVDDGYYFMETGEGVHPQSGIKADDDLSINLPSAPVKPSIEFGITQASPSAVRWDMPDTATPQFRYTVDVDERQLGSEIDSNVRSHPITGAIWGSVITVTLEDLLGNVVSHKTRVGY